MTYLIAILILAASPPLAEPSKHRTNFSFAEELPDEMLAQSNRLAGLNRTLDSSLTKAAQDYADLLARTRQQGHFCDGWPPHRAARAGFTGSLEFGERQGNWYFDGGRWKRERVVNWGEVLAFGPPDADVAFQAWLDSPGHRAALMEPTFNCAGFGRNGRIFVAMFGRSQ